MTRHYLSDDDVAYQRQINRTVREMTDPAPVVNRRRNPPATAEDPWHCDIEEDGDDITLTFRVGRSSDGYKTVVFRGNAYSLLETSEFEDPGTVHISRSDLSSVICAYIVRGISSGGFYFRIGLSRSGEVQPGSGAVLLAYINLTDGQIRVSMQMNALYEWPDLYPSDNGFTATLGFTEIPSYSSGFTDFLTAAVQKLALSNRYSLVGDGVYMFATGISAIYSADYQLFSVDAADVGSGNLLAFFNADYNCNSLSNIRYTVEQDPNNTNIDYKSISGQVRFPLAQIGNAWIYSSSTLLRIIYGSARIANLPEMWLNTFGIGWDPLRSSLVYMDHANQQMRVRIYATFAGVIKSRSSWELAASFQAVQSALGSSADGELALRAYYNIADKTWSDPYFVLASTPLTPEPQHGGSDSAFSFLIATIGKGSSVPYVIGQNFQRHFYFDALSGRVTDVEGSITNIYRILDNYNQRITALEQRN